MKIEIPALESEPLIYFLFHSSAFVVALGTSFFLLGLCLAWLTWGRYKRGNRILQEELARLEEEIISLKRKLAEQAIRPPSKPIPMPVSVAPVQVPGVNHDLPALAFESPPAAVAESVATYSTDSDLGMDRNVIAEAFPDVSSLPHENLSGNGIRKGLARSPVQSRQFKVSAEAPPPLVSPKPRRFPMSDENGSSGVAPFSFLMGPAPETEAHEKHDSPLNAIIAPKAATVAEPALKSATETAAAAETAAAGKAEPTAVPTAEAEAKEESATVAQES